MKFCQSLPQNVVPSWQKDILVPWRALQVPRTWAKDISDLWARLRCHNVWFCRTFAKLGVRLGTVWERRVRRRRRGEPGSEKETEREWEFWEATSVVGPLLIYNLWNTPLGLEMAARERGFSNELIIWLSFPSLLYPLPVGCCRLERMTGPCDREFYSLLKFQSSAVCLQLPFTFSESLQMAQGLWGLAFSSHLN